MVVKCISVVTVIVSLGTEHFGRVLRETQLFFMNMKVRGLAEPLLSQRITICKIKRGRYGYHRLQAYCAIFDVDGIRRGGV